MLATGLLALAAALAVGLCFEARGFARRTRRRLAARGGACPRTGETEPQLEVHACT
jgi:hypothetical protein